MNLSWRRFLRLFLLGGVISAFQQTSLTAAEQRKSSEVDAPTPTFFFRKTNLTPVVTAISPQQVNEEKRFILTPSTVDTFAKGKLYWSLGSGTPEGMSINPLTGAIFWQTSETNGGAKYMIALTARNLSPPFLSDTETFELVVKEVNKPPLLKDAEVTTIGGYPLRWQVQATDADLPRQNIRYRLQGTIPEGMSITQQGLIRWKVPPITRPQEGAVTVVVTDGEFSTSALRRFYIVPFEQIEQTTALSVNDSEDLLFKIENTPSQGFEASTASDLGTWEPQAEASVKTD